MFCERRSEECEEKMSLKHFSKAISRIRGWDWGEFCTTSFFRSVGRQSTRIRHSGLKIGIFPTFLTEKIEKFSIRDFERWTVMYLLKYRKVFVANEKTGRDYWGICVRFIMRSSRVQTRGLKTFQHPYTFKLHFSELKGKVGSVIWTKVWLIVRAKLNPTMI